MTVSRDPPRRVRKRAEVESARPKPLKRPTQPRAKFTVQAVYDAFVRIWQRGGWRAVTTRAVALEAGVAIGTLYDYFPNREALLSGYVRQCIEVLLERLDAQVLGVPGLTPEQRLHALVRLTCSRHANGLPWFDRDMLLLESVIAETKHHRRVFEELTQRWQLALSLVQGTQADPTEVAALLASIWGGRRYLLLLDASDKVEERWVCEVESLCRARFLGLT